jgi:hypothetical protein
MNVKRLIGALFSMGERGAFWRLGGTETSNSSQPSTTFRDAEGIEELWRF